METAESRLILYNVVVVFSELRIILPLREIASQLLPDHPIPVITEIPNQLLVVAFPNLQIECQFANRRVEVRDRRGLVPGDPPFPMIAVNAVNSVVQVSSKPIVAYGYNFDVLLPAGVPEAGDFIRTSFLRRPQDLQEAFGGTAIKGVGISAAIVSQDSLATFSIENVPEQAQQIKAHVNYHFEGKVPPSVANELAEEIDRKYQGFLSALRRL